MRIKANYNFNLWSSSFVKGKEYTISDEKLCKQLNGLAPNPFGWPMFTELEKEEEKVSKEPKPSKEPTPDLPDPEIEKLQQEYEKKFEKPVPPTYKNNKEWLEKKLAD